MRFCKKGSNLFWKSKKKFQVCKRKIKYVLETKKEKEKENIFERGFTFMR